MKSKQLSSLTRTAILDAASRVILQKGAEALTLEAVAQEAAISKGGLLYHFATKKSLIAGMIERLIRQVDAAIEREMLSNGGDFLKAYIQISITENPDHTRISCALFAAIANDPVLLEPLQAHYRQWQERAAASAATPEAGTLIRLALDGLWVSDLLNFAPPSPAMRAKIQTILLAIQEEK